MSNNDVVLLQCVLYGLSHECCDAGVTQTKVVETINLTYERYLDNGVINAV